MDTLEITVFNKLAMLPELWAFRYRKIGHQYVLPRLNWGEETARQREARRRKKANIRALVKNLDLEKLAAELQSGKLYADDTYIHHSYYITPEELDLLYRCQRAARCQRAS